MLYLQVFLGLCLQEKYHMLVPDQIVGQVRQGFSSMQLILMAWFIHVQCTKKKKKLNLTKLLNQTNLLASSVHHLIQAVCASLIST